MAKEISRSARAHGKYPWKIDEMRGTAEFRAQKLSGKWKKKNIFYALEIRSSALNPVQPVAGSRSLSLSLVYFVGLDNVEKLSLEATRIFKGTTSLSIRSS